MAVFLVVSIFYVSIIFILSSIFSVGLFGSIISLSSDNFECGFYPILRSMLKYKFNYWMITIHFLISEQELILVLLLTGGLKTLNGNNLLCLLLGILFIDVCLMLEVQLVNGGVLSCFYLLCFDNLYSF